MLSNARLVPIGTTKTQLIDIIARALMRQTNDIATLLARALSPLPRPTHLPLTSDDRGQYLWTAWHHGGETMICAVGTSDLLHFCALTDTEREQLTLNLRRAETFREIGYVIATGVHTTNINSLSPHSLTCVGLVFCPADY